MLKYPTMTWRLLFVLGGITWRLLKKYSFSKGFMDSYILVKVPKALEPISLKCVNSHHLVVDRLLNYTLFGFQNIASSLEKP